jgi:prepilin-type processing-associated H-X9-DG protein
MVKCWNGEVAMSALLASPIAAPTHVAVSDNLDFLDLTTAQGDEVRLPAGRLRAACKCAHCIRARIDGKFPDRFDGIAITQVSPIGDYAINIAFSDGHARGIYPWSYLSELAVV